MDLAGQPMLSRVVTRSRRASLLDEVVVATTTLAQDDAVAELCERMSWPVIRGDESDVLGRYVDAARVFGAEIVVRITSDCPLVDPEIVDEHVRQLITRWRELDLVTNALRPSYPMGLSVEAMPIDALQRMDRLSTSPDCREHVTLIAYERPDIFLIGEVTFSGDNLSAKRWTVDTPTDLAFAAKVFEHFGHDHFTWREVLEVGAVCDW
jgi:spore coat polysaccharide biosynthesis protein SpsF